MSAHASRLENRLLATAAMGLALAVTAPYREGVAADICVGGGLTTITTAQAGADNCVLDAGESVDVQAGGSIPFTGASDAIAVETSAAAGSINNAGSVSSTTQGIELRSNSSLSSGITNSGTMTGGNHGIAAFPSATITGNITNTGDITGTTFDAIVLRSGSTVTGTVTNSAGGTMTGGNFGILLDDNGSVNSGIANAGTITTTNNDGILLQNNSTVDAGGIDNSGTITSGDEGINLDQTSSVTGGITNSGTINAGASGIFVDGSSSVTSDGITNESGGDITAVGFGIIISSTSTVAGGITNQGDITSTGNDGIGLNGGGTTVAGGITNASGATIDGSDEGISLENSASVTSGGISNSGTITASTDDAILINSASVTGGIANTSTGSITGADLGIALTNGASVTGGITNSGALNASGRDTISVAGSTVAGGIANAGSGSIDAAGSGIVLDGSSLTSDGISNASDADIDAADFGILIDNTSAVTGGITNAGDIAAFGDDGVLVRSNSTIAGGITNVSGATIDGSDDGIELNNMASVTSGGLTNAGTISAADDGIGISGQASLTGNLTNAVGGQIDSGDDGILLTNGTLVGNLVNAGTIDADGEGINIAATSTVTGNVSNAGTIDAGGDGIDINVSSTVTGNVSNAGTIDANGDGIVLIGSSTIDGSVVNTGTIDAGGDGVLLSFNDTITGSIQNSGTITAAGEGIKLASSGTVTGTILNSGTITADESGLVVSSSAVTGGIVNQAGGTITGGTHAIEIINPTGSITITNAGQLDGDVALHDGTLDLNGSSARVDGVISGLASSTVNINGDFSTEGDIDVGTLTVASTGELTLENDVDVDSAFNNAGTVAIADGATRTVTGDYTQTGNGRLQIVTTSDSSFGKLVASGTVDLSASNDLHVTIGNGASLRAGDALLDVVQAGTLTANAVTVTDTSALLNFEGVVDGNTIDLEVASSRSIETIADDADGNGGGAGGALDDIIAGGASGDMQTVIDALNALGTDQEVNDAVEKMLPAITGGHAQGTVAAAQAGATNVVQERLIRLSGLSAGDALFADPAAWIKPFAADTAQGSRGGVSGYDGLTAGAAVGIDGRFTEDLRAGLALSYADTTINGRGVSDSSVDLDTIQLTAYGTYDIDRETHINLLGVFGWNENESRRVIDFGGLDRTAEADYDSWHGIADVELVRSYKLSKDLGFMPSVGATYTYVRAEDYSETGAGAANLDVDDSDADSLTLTTAGKLIYETEPGVNVTGNLGLAYDVLAGDDQVTATFEGGGGAFVTESIDPAPLGVTAGVGLELVPATGIDASLNYDIEAREDFRSHKVQLNFRIPF